MAEGIDEGEMSETASFVTDDASEMSEEGGSSEAGGSSERRPSKAGVRWGKVREHAATLERDGMAPAPALASAQSAVVGEQIQRVSIPKRFSIPMREIWHLQPRFHRRRAACTPEAV